MTFRLYKTHAKGEGYTYRELYGMVIEEWGLRPVPDIGAMSREASHIIRNYLVKEGFIDRIIDKKGHSRYIPKTTRPVTHPILLGTDASTGYNTYALSDEKNFAVIDEEWNVRPKAKTRYVRITISTTFSLDTSGKGSHQRLKFYEATAFTTIPYSDIIDVTAIGKDLRDFIREAFAYYFNPGVAEASEIKIGVEIMSSPPEESLGESTVFIEYGHFDTKAGGYATLKKTKTQMRSEKAQKFEPHAGKGRISQKKLEEFEK